MSVEDDYLQLRRAQKKAREEMWHVFSHHPEFQKEWESGHGIMAKFETGGGCYALLKEFVEWEPDD